MSQSTKVILSKWRNQKLGHETGISPCDSKQNCCILFFPSPVQNNRTTVACSSLLIEFFFFFWSNGKKYLQRALQCTFMKHTIFLSGIVPLKNKPRTVVFKATHPVICFAWEPPSPPRWAYFRPRWGMFRKGTRAGELLSSCCTQNPAPDTTRCRRLCLNNFPLILFLK